MMEAPAEPSSAQAIATHAYPPSTPAWLAALLSDPTHTDILIHAGERVPGYVEVFADGPGGLRSLAHTTLDWADPGAEARLRRWVLDGLGAVQRTWDAKYPFCDFVLGSGHRVHAALAYVSEPGLLVSLRRTAITNRRESQGTSPRAQWAHDPAYAHLAERFRAGDTLWLTGATGSGKTTLGSALLSEVDTHERLLAIEDTPELLPEHPHFVRLMSRTANTDGHGEISLRQLLRESLRMRPDRIILGECRGAEVLELLMALNTGHRGSLATLHANSARDGLRRVELLCLVASHGSIQPAVIRELIASGIRWIVHLERHHGRRRIAEVLEIVGREGETLLSRPWPSGASR